MCGCVGAGHAQNLVPNGSFENFEKCPTESAQFNLVKHWKSASQATPDLMCSCANDNSLVNVNLNFAGRQSPHTGDCYAGLLAYHSDNYYEYLMVKLQSPLVKNKKYLLDFFYSLSDFSDKKVLTLGASFLKDPMEKPGHEQLLESQLIDTISNNIRLWQQFQEIYTATGDETYLLLGCFTKNFDRAYGDRPPEGKYGPRDQDHFAYYYIDDVSVTEYNGQALTPREHTPNKINTVRAHFIPESICFDVDKSEILPEYKPKLDKLATHLQQHPAYRVDLTGHTDNTGDENHNEQLSLDRVNAVKAYLVKKGIAVKRISLNGFGSKKPATSNATESGKHKNRRVECRVIAQ